MASLGLLIMGEIFISRIVLLVMLPIAVFIFRSKGKLMKTLSIVIFIAICLGLFFSAFFMEKVSGDEMDQILSRTDPLIDNFLENYNTLNFSAIAKDFSESLKELFSEEQATHIYNMFGNYVSKKEPDVHKQGDMIHLSYEIKFEKIDAVLNINILKDGEVYLINGLSFNYDQGALDSGEPAANTGGINPINISIESKVMLESIETSEGSFIPGEGNLFLIFNITAKNNNDKTTDLVGFKFKIENTYFGMIDFDFYPNLKEFCKPIELGTMESSEKRDGCVIFILKKDNIEGNITADVKES